MEDNEFIAENEEINVNDLFGLPDSLMMPTLLDMIVHSTPDLVLGDGGSMYLKMDIPESEFSPLCHGCPTAEGNDRKKTQCKHRAYEVATTRDHARVQIGSGFYCTNPDRYVEAGEQMENLLKGKIKVVQEEISKVIKEEYNLIESNKDQIKNGVIQKELAKGLELFENLFCGRKKETLKRHYNPCSKITAAICDALDLPKESLKAGEFEKAAEALAIEIEKDLKKQISSKGEKNSSPLYRPVRTLFRFTSALYTTRDRKTSVKKEILEAKEALKEETFKKKETHIPIQGIIWELIRSHELLEDTYQNFQKGRSSIREKYPALGLSGWVAAFGVPMQLRNIENPLEIQNYPKWIMNKLQKTDQKRYQRINDGFQDKKIKLPPIPVWGDLARGHQDRIEREGRPFLGIPILKPSDENDTGKIETLGFFRVATKREGERYFTGIGRDRLEKYSRRIADFLEREEVPVNGLENRKTTENKKNREKTIRSFWWSLRLYGAVKGQSTSELGHTAARAFREVFQATAVSLFLREDLLHQKDPRKEEDAGDKGDENQPEDKGRDGDEYKTQRRYLLWGTDIDKEYIEVDKKARNLYEKFKAKAKDKIDPLAYHEEQGKTGRAIKFRAALMAYYKDDRNRIVRLSNTQHVHAEIPNDKELSDDNWEYKLPTGVPAHDPLDVNEIVKDFIKKEESESGVCEVSHEKHRMLLMAPLIDPDISPEPFGIVRMIIAEPDKSISAGSSKKQDLDKLAVEQIFYPMARFARGLSRLLRPNQIRRRLLNTFRDIIEYSNRPYISENSPWNDKPFKKLPGGILVSGPLGRVASSFLRLGEASAVSIFVHNDYAPSLFKEPNMKDETWVLVGTAAASDALTALDKKHFIDMYCREYFKKTPGKCRYKKELGRTGQAIKTGKLSYVEKVTVEEHKRSEYLCEVESPSALLIIPTPTGSATSSKEDKSIKVAAIVRFVRTEERRHAKFLKEEQQRLNSVVHALQWLVPSWSEQNDLREFQRAWKNRSQRYFPEQMQQILLDWLVPKKENSDTEKSSKDRIRETARKLPQWVESDSEDPPTKVTGAEVKEHEKQLLAKFLLSLEEPSLEKSLTDIISKFVKALLRLHWGPDKAKVWIKKLELLSRFEPVLSEIPRYRDHSVHQFQVFLIGWLLLKELEKGNELEVEYIGWSLEDSEKKRDENHTVNLSKINASAWVLASVFHDIAYPLQHVYSWANLFGRALTSVDHEVEFVKKGDTESFFPKSELNTSFAFAQELLVSGILNSINVKPTESFPLKDRVLSIMEKPIQNWDHGIWAALVLLNSTDATDAIMEAAVAISFHNGLFMKLAENLEGQKLKLRLIPDGQYPTAQPTALSFLLLLSDAIHEWGREVDKEKIDENELKDFFIRPALLRLETQKDKKEDGEDTETGETRPKESRPIEVDIAMGRQANGGVLQRKVDEFKELSKFLDPGDRKILIRVCREDPDDLSEQAVNQHTIVFSDKKKT